jgi:hypothetical protein
LLSNFDGVEKGGEEGHAGRVTHHDDDVGEVFGKDMEMEHGPVIVDDEFGTGDGFSVHGQTGLKNKYRKYFVISQVVTMES